jgi:hypothetical protein
VTIYNGTSSGGWEAKGTLGVGTDPYSVFVFDANNDGYNDIVTADRTDDTVTIYNGTSSNDWEAKGTLDVGDFPRSVFVGDANNDGCNDILTADYSDDTVTIYKSTGGGWRYRKPIIINSSQVTSDLTNFPVLISITDSSLKDHARSDAYDIYFTTIDGVTKLNHEIEYYNSATGELFAWVRFPNLSSTADQMIYMYYGNPISPDQSNPTAVWDSNYVMVQHLNETGTGTRFDSTSNNNDGTPIAYDGDEAITGKIDGAEFLEDGDVDSGEHINCGNDPSLQIEGNLTLEAWVRIEGSSGEYMGIAGKLNYSVSYNGYALVRHSSNEFRFYVADGDISGAESDSTYTDNDWHYLVGTINGSSDINYLFVDGVQQTDTDDNNLTDPAEGAFIGRQYADYDQRYWQGDIDEVRISNIPRSADWIATSYNNQNNTSSFYTVYPEEILSYQWVELYNKADCAINLTGWTLSDNDGNTFNLTGAGNLPSNNYLVCHFGVSGTNTSTAVYGSPGGRLDDTDDLALLGRCGMIVDYVAWGGDPGFDDDVAVATRRWTDGTYVNTSNLLENQTIGRDKDSNDTDSPDDWENTATNKADPYGVNASQQTPYAQNIDCIIVIPEFDMLVVPIMIMAVVLLYFKRLSISHTKKYKKSKPNSGKSIKKQNTRKIR